MNAAPTRQQDLLADLKRQRAESLIELANPNLFSLARKSIDSRIQILDSEICELEGSQGMASHTKQETEVDPGTKARHSGLEFGQRNGGGAMSEGAKWSVVKWTNQPPLVNDNY